MNNVNKEYKDRLFVFIFGREENKRWTLSLYNSINGTSYTNEDDIEITTMSDTVYMGMKNDVSFLISDMLNLYEQQSTYNPNMPVRQLMYLGRQYDKYIKKTKQNIYGSKLMHLPVPKLITFYNGAEDVEDTVLRLSDSFEICAQEADVQVSVRLINVSGDHNRQLLQMCEPLREYVWFVEMIRSKRNQGIDLEKAVDTTIDEMPETCLIRECLIENRAEVKNMCITEYNEEETMRMFKEEGREEGRQEGRQEGREEGREEGRREGQREGTLSAIVNLMKSLKCTAEQAMDKLRIPQSDRAEYMQMLSK